MHLLYKLIGRFATFVSNAVRKKQGRNEISAYFITALLPLFYKIFGLILLFFFFLHCAFRYLCRIPLIQQGLFLAFVLLIAGNDEVYGKDEKEAAPNCQVSIYIGIAASYKGGDAIQYTGSDCAFGAGTHDDRHDACDQAGESRKYTSRSSDILSLIHGIQNTNGAGLEKDNDTENKGNNPEGEPYFFIFSSPSEILKYFS